MVICFVILSGPISGISRGFQEPGWLCYFLSAMPQVFFIIDCFFICCLDSEVPDDGFRGVSDGSIGRDLSENPFYECEHGDIRIDIAHAGMREWFNGKVLWKYLRKHRFQSDWSDANEIVCKANYPCFNHFLSCVAVGLFAGGFRASESEGVWPY